MIRSRSFFASLGFTLACGAAFLLQASSCLYRVYRLHTISTQWVELPAELLRYQQTAERRTAPLGSRYTTPHLLYAYTLDGQRYESGELGYATSRDTAILTNPDNAPGAFRLTCHTNPQNPSESVLFCDSDCAPGLGSALLSLALLLLTLLSARSMFAPGEKG